MQSLILWLLESANDFTENISDVGILLQIIRCKWPHQHWWVLVGRLRYNHTTELLVIWILGLHGRLICWKHLTLLNCLTNNTVQRFAGVGRIDCIAHIWWVMKQRCVRFPSCLATTWWFDDTVNCLVVLEPTLQHWLGKSSWGRQWRPCSLSNFPRHKPEVFKYHMNNT